MIGSPVGENYWGLAGAGLSNFRNVVWFDFALLGGLEWPHPGWVRKIILGRHFVAFSGPFTRRYADWLNRFFRPL